MPGEPLNEEETKTRIEIWNMFHALKTSYDCLEDKGGVVKSRLEFEGFDGNDPYERRFIGPDGKNSLRRMLPRYQLMVERWKASSDPQNLTREDVLRITAPA
jgi:uncharacterized protein YfbU (UPF0304 family)